MQGSEVDVDGIQRRLGCGRFQLLVFVTLGVIYSRGAWHVFGIMFLAGDPGHQCALPQPHAVESELSVSSSSFLSSSLSDSVNNHTGSYGSGSSAVDVLPVDLGGVKRSALYSAQEGVSLDLSVTNWTAGSCTVSYIMQNGSQVPLAEDCPYGWTYGSLFENTVLSEWNLVCDRDYLVELSITVFMIGATGGAVLLLPLADRWGRKRVMLGCLLTQAGVGTAAAFVQSYIAFTVLRFIIGMLNIGIGLCSYVLMTETFPTQQRTVVSIAFQAFWALGVMTVAGFGFLLRNWRHLELMMTLPNLLALPCCWLLPESLPWLISQKKWPEVIATITTIAKVNRKDPTSITPLIPTHTPTTTDTTTTTTTPACCCPDNTSTLFSTNQNTEDRASERSSGNQNTEDRASSRSSANQNTEDRDSSRSSANQNTEDRASSRSSASQKAGDGSSNNVAESDIDAMIDREHCSNGVSGSGNGLHPADHHYIGAKRSAEDAGKDGCRGDNNGHAGSLVNGTCQSRNDSEQPSEQQASVSILDLFRHRRMSLYSCVMFFLFFVSSLGYFGISFSVPTLHGNQFLNLGIMGAVEIPANLICVIVGHRVGRRYPNAMFLLLCGLSNIAAIFLPSHIGWLKLVMVMVGKFAITAAYSTIYLYSAEIFPTVIRNQAMGMSSVFENIGSISAPFIVLAAKSIPEVPLVVFGVLTVCGAGLTLLLPETHNRPLPQTVLEITTW